jgi:undecaprenyl-diphosphatase
MSDTETKFLLWVQEEVRNGILTPLFTAITHTADGGWIWFAVAGGLLCSKKTRNTGMGCLCAMGLNVFVVNVLLKNAVLRIRPYERTEELDILCRPPKDYSFPSGHTAISFAAASYIFADGHPKSGAVALVYAGLVGLSRLYIGVHYPSDVLAGAAIGTACALFTKFLRNRKRQK